MARPKNLRQQRLGGEIQQYLADILRSFAEEAPELNGILIELTEVRLTPDLQQVRAYLLTIPAEKLEYTVRFLNQYHKELRYALAQRIRHFVKVMPTIQFFPDETELKARRIEELLQKLPPPAADSDSGESTS
jgi:ribosome-binding factor A